MKLSLILLAAPLTLACITEDSYQQAPMTVATTEIAYEVDGVEMTGFIARPDGVSDLRPGILVVHEWWGHNDYVRTRARQLAEMGYVAFALDMYGDGKSASHPADAQGFMQEVMGNRDVMVARFDAAFELLREQDGVDPERTGAIGYCMGGAIVLDMALSGADVDAVASFHGSLPPSLSVQPASADTKVLICTGAADPFIPEDQVEAVRSKLESADCSFEIVSYEGAMHGFTNPGATAKGEEFDIPLRYDAEADADSWARMTKLFAETF